MERRFTALRVIGTVFKVVAWIGLIMGLLGAIALLILGFTLSGIEDPLGLGFGGPLAGLAMFVVALVLTATSFLALYAVGESVYLLLDLEENTRRAAYLLQQQYTAYQPAYPPAMPRPEDYED